MNSAKKVIVIGGGIAGYPAAIKAARLGAQVTLLEKADMGGTCLNWGCIPTKSLLNAAEVAHTVENAAAFGIRAGKPQVDFPVVMKRKDQVVAQLRKGVESLVAAKKIELIREEARLLGPGKVLAAASGRELTADAVILATGSAPAMPPIPGLEKAGAWDSNDFLAMKKLPASAVIIGGGVIGVEFAQILAGLGAKVTVLEMMNQVAPGLDREIAGLLAHALNGQGIEVITGATVSKAVKDGRQKRLHYQAGGKEAQVEADCLIVAAGRRSVTPGMEPDKLGLAVENGAIKVDAGMATSLPGVWAAGDVVGGAMLAHVALAEGECAAVNALGGQRRMDYRAVPSCIYSRPEVASVGLSEEAAREKGEIKVGRFRFAGCGKAVVSQGTEGLVKVITAAQHGEILGVHVIGPRATDLIAEGVLAMGLECTAEELAHAMHPHPTYSEALMEAALTLAGGAVHMP